MIVLTKSLAFFASSWWAIAHMLCGKRALFVEEAFDFPFNENTRYFRDILDRYIYIYYRFMARLDITGKLQVY